MRLWCFSLTLIMPYVKLMKVKKWDRMYALLG